MALSDLLCMAFYGSVWPCIFLWHFMVFYGPFIFLLWKNIDLIGIARSFLAVIDAKPLVFFLKKNTSETREAETLNHVSSLRHLATPLLLPSEVNDSSTKLVLFNYYMLSS